MQQVHQNIERYLDGDLNQAELAEFEAALQADPNLAESLARHREMTQRLDALRLRNKVKAATQAQHHRGQTLYTRRRYWALAASLVLLASAIWFFYQQTSPLRSDWADQPVSPSPSEQPAPLPETTPLEPTPEQVPNAQPDAQRSRQLALAREYILQPSSSMIRDAAQQPDASASKTIARQAAEAYEKQHYRQAADLLKNDALVAEDDALRFLRANARFQAEQFPQAASDFEALKQSFQFKHEARWNFILCLLAEGKNDQVGPALKAMREETDFPFQERAARLSEALLIHGSR